MEPTLDEALLTAYLDGELSPQDRQSLEQRLANEPGLRQRLTVLEETWHYLDLLELECADVEKIETTLKIAAVSVAGKPFVPQKIRRWGTWGITALAGLAIFLVTFNFGKRSELDDPSFRRQIERLDMYLAIANDEEGLELLRYLAIQGVFLPPRYEDEPPPDPNDYLPGSRIGSVFNTEGTSWNDFDHGDHNQFYRNLQTYNSLSRDRKVQIRKLHQDIESALRGDELLLTLQNYYHWRKSLQSYERIALRQPKPPVEKAADIIELKTRLDRFLSEDALAIPSEIIGIEESERLSDTLKKLHFEEQSRLLNEEPILMINKLNQWSHH